MSCIYKYGNMTFDSELELDDFLLNAGPELLEKYGDTVFQDATDSQLRWWDHLKIVAQESRKSKIEGFKKKYNRELQTLEPDVSGHTNVTKFLSGLKINDGFVEKLLFPEFIEENYFNNRIESWKSNKEKRFTEKELQDFAEEPEFKDGKVPQTMTQELINRLIRIQKEKWEHEAKVGTAIHNLCELFFSRQDNRGHKFAIWGDKSRAEILKYFLRKADKTTLEMLSEPQRKEVLDYCIELRKAIESKYSGQKKGQFIYLTETKLTSKVINPQEGKTVSLAGMIDLIVIPPEGNPFIIDYKVSPADYGKEQKRNVLPEDMAPDEYSSAKKRAFHYQLATYARMLKKNNPAMRHIEICVAPIQLMDYKRNNGIWNFSKIKKTELLNSLSEDLDANMKVNERLDSIFVDIGIAQLDNEDMLKKLKSALKLWFTKFKPKELGWTVEDVEELIKEENSSYTEDKDAEDLEKKYSYTLYGKTIYAKSKVELISKIQEQTQTFENNIGKTTSNFISAVQHNVEPTKLYSNKLESTDGKSNWFGKVIRKYVKHLGQYEVLTEDDGVPSLFTDMGIVLLRDKWSKNIEVIKFTADRITGKVDRFNKNKLVTQAIGISDIVDKSGKNYLFDSVNGNVSLMETMLALNFVAPEVFSKSKVSGIKVINPYINSGLTATNKQLIYNFKTLNKYRNIDSFFGRNRIFYDNNGGDIKFCTAAEVALGTLQSGLEIANRNREGRNMQIVEQIANKCLTPLEQLFLEKEEETDVASSTSQTEPQKSTADVLYDAIIQMEELIAGLRERNLEKLEFDITEEEADVQYQALLRAYAEELGYDFKQQIDALDEWIDHTGILLYGHSGLRTDNPGTTASDNLNKITQFIEDCYKRVTDSMQRPHAKTQNMIIKLKKDNRITYLGDSTFQNSIRIYDNMTNYKERTSTQDWLFKNPYSSSTTLKTNEQEFLKYILLKINYNRFGKEGESEKAFEARMIDEINNKGNIAYLRVPLAYKGTQGKLEVKGLIAGARDYFISWVPKNLKDRLIKKYAHLMTPEGKQLKDDIYNMRTQFDRGENPEERVKMLKDLDFYDHDLQSVFLKHLFSYNLKHESIRAFALIKAAQADIVMSEFTQNRTREAEQKYLLNNVKIMTGRSLMEDKSLLINEYAKMIMKAASVVTLGFNPKQIYQNLEGIYKDIGILWRAEDGQYGFSLTDLVAAFCNVYKELIKYGFQPTKLERLNQLYRINDMDINVYAQHLQNSHNIIRNFSSFTFRFASRPDFYNRMTIFEAYMRADGTFDAYQLNKEGELIYDFYADKRFDILQSGNTNHPKYREQEALYRAMAKQFEVEGAIYADGTKFKFEPPVNGKYKPLPQAYTNKQAHSYKAMADKLYGYYSHEKKALMQSSLLGALFWQMNTYWSGKKNQWFAISSVKDRGWFTHYSEVELDENGKPILENGKEKRKYYYYQVDKDGKILFDEQPVTQDQLINQDVLVPFYQWEGMFSEGIAVTMYSMFHDAMAMFISDRSGLIQPKGSDYEELLVGERQYTKDLSKIISAVREQYWNNPNENLRRAYRQNIKQFAYDMAVLSVVGSLLGGQIHLFVNDYTNDHKEDHNIEQAMKNASLALSEAIFDSATLDFDPFESIGGRGVNWTPFALSTIKRCLHIWSRVITGDDSLTDGFLKTFSANRYTVNQFIKQLHNPTLEDQNVDTEIRQAA